MGLAVPGRVSVEVAAPEGIDFAAFEQAPEPTLLLVRDIASVLLARRHGLVCPTLNLGNVHFSPGRAQITPSVFLSPEELASLEALAAEGVRVEVRAVPREKPLPLSEVLLRLGARAPGPRD
jgi:mannose/fructose/N-acetylgalactosamine-specific phosphotransferase system component IIB